MKRTFLFLIAMLVIFPVQVPSAEAAMSTKKVEIFVTSWCPYCKKLETFLKKEKIDYTRYDIEQDPKGGAIFSSIGGEGVPVIRVGKEVIHGYDPDAVLAAIHAQED